LVSWRLGVQPNLVAGIKWLLGKNKTKAALAISGSSGVSTRFVDPFSVRRT